MENIIEVQNVSKAFTNHVALDNVSLQVPVGKVYGLLGPNGAGKTTLLRIINHITAPDSGQVLFDGHPITAEDIVNIGYLPEERGLYKKMKVGDQCLFFARLKGLSKAEALKSLHEWFERLEITSWWDKKVEELSKGMAQKVQFIVTVLHRPRLLIFDEPFSGFDPINANVLKNEILALRDQGATVIFSTHNMASVEEICDNITLINRSHNILSGNVAQLRRDYGGNRYAMTMTGDATPLIGELSSIGATMVIDNIDADGLTHATLSLPTGDDAIRAVIAKANEMTMLQSFNRILPSMNDVFISAVERANSSNDTTTNSIQAQ